MLMLAQSSLTSSAVGWPMVLASLSLILLALGLAWALGLRIERELIVASVRAAAQLLAVGFVFVLIFEESLCRRIGQLVGSIGFEELGIDLLDRDRCRVA